FGVDPVSGRTDRRVLSAVDGHPGRLVGGEVAGSRYVVSPRGRVVRRDAAPPEEGGGRLGRRERHAVLHLGHRADVAFGSPQDIEWALDASGRAWLLQARPVTSVAPRGLGPLLG